MSKDARMRETPTDTQRHADRAAQFMPFAALTGYYDLVREQGAATDACFDELGERIFAEGAGSLPFGARDEPGSSDAPGTSGKDPTPGDNARGSRPDPP